MTINPLTAEDFEGLEKHEGKWVEIFRVKVERAFQDKMVVVFDTKAHFDDPIRAEMVFYTRDNIESEIKCVATYAHAYAFRDQFEIMRGRGHVIVVLKMWKICNCFKTEGGFSDFRFNPCLEEVEEFRQSVNSSDPYVGRHGAI
ncbi:unnamed protein product [Eruca vesicaria subsp. sativa]|uniref:Uncharacterized protein n=1 Tax=Eruca vesicaria subsp. sativa TaxID=29727 RepID=A0ABC8JKI5_ERUVS|nr:unnamed protein product [Eruca vesicaria subsp. sativa]